MTKRIADKLDGLLARVDACRERLNRVPGILKRFRKAVLAAATTGELTREWREERGLDSSWTEVRIEDIADVGTGSTPLRSNSTYFASKGTAWVTSAVTGSPFVTHAKEFVTDIAISAHRLKLYPVGTLLVAMYGEGKTRGQVTELRIEATINQACAAIRVNEERAARTFVRIVLESNYLEMRELAEGGSQPNLNLSKIKEFSLSLPSFGEQAAIVDRVAAIEAWVNTLERRSASALKILGVYQSAALSKAFRGELLPQDPNDEPASKLLARIRDRPDSPAEARRSKPGNGTLRLRTKAKGERKMMARKDVTSTILTDILKKHGAMAAEALWSASQLEIDDFYDQLKEEEARGVLRERPGESANLFRILELVP